MEVPLATLLVPYGPCGAYFADSDSLTEPWPCLPLDRPFAFMEGSGHVRNVFRRAARVYRIDSWRVILVT